MRISAQSRVRPMKYNSPLHAHIKIQFTKKIPIELRILVVSPNINLYKMSVYNSTHVMKICSRATNKQLSSLRGQVMDERQYLRIREAGLSDPGNA